MKYNNKNTRCNGFGSIVNGVTNFLTKGWELITTPSTARCEAYSEQASYAKEQMRKDGISRKDRKFWAKQNQNAMDGLSEVHMENSNTFVRAICAIGAGLFLGYKLFNKSNGGLNDVYF